MSPEAVVDRAPSVALIDAAHRFPIYIFMTANEKDDGNLIQSWDLCPEATFGSSVRSRGLLLEIRARLPLSFRKSLDIDGRTLCLAMPGSSKEEFREVSGVIEGALQGIESLPVIPREIEDILTIKTTERHRWLKDGRLPSAGTRTVKLRGRASQITFHVFDPRVVEDILDRGMVDEWRVEDAEAAAENRRRGAWKAKVTRSMKYGGTADPSSDAELGDGSRPGLSGWEEFGREGLLR